MQCSYFTLDYVYSREPFTIDGGVLQGLLVVHGRGRLEGGADERPLVPGNTLLLPAALDALTFHPERELGLLLSTLPQN